MSKEVMYLRFVQAVIALNSFLLLWAIIAVKKGNLERHRHIMLWVVVSTLSGAVGLVVTVLWGWDYSHLTSLVRLNIHRSFSSPLLVLLPITAILGYVNRVSWHKPIAYLTLFFWLGTLVTGLWFF